MEKHGNNHKWQDTNQSYLSHLFPNHLRGIFAELEADPRHQPLGGSGGHGSEEGHRPCSKAGHFRDRSNDFGFVSIGLLIEVV